jgi:hypothetical protein
MSLIILTPKQKEIYKKEQRKSPRRNRKNKSILQSNTTEKQSSMLTETVNFEELGNQIASQELDYIPKHCFHTTFKNRKQFLKGILEKTQEIRGLEKTQFQTENIEFAKELRKFALGVGQVLTLESQKSKEVYTGILFKETSYTYKVS